MPYESDLVSTEEYTDQLMFVENILFNNSDCHVIIAGDFNVDFSRSWPHTALLNSFCDNHGLIAADGHSKNTVDCTYQFNIERFCTLDHFLLSGIIFEEFVSSVSASHDIDNLSDQEVINLQLRIECASFGAAERTFSSRVSWVKATNNDLCKYQYTLSEYLKSIRLPVETLLCADAHCCNASHSQAINAYMRITSLKRVYLQERLLYRSLAIDLPVGAYLDGLNSCSRRVISRCSGTIVMG
jgi:hypothetical protein